MKEMQWLLKQHVFKCRSGLSSISAKIMQQARKSISLRAT
jgi:hypothetical protein